MNRIMPPPALNSQGCNNWTESLIFIYLPSYTAIPASTVYSVQCIMLTEKHIVYSFCLPIFIFWINTVKALYLYSASLQSRIHNVFLNHPHTEERGNYARHQLAHREMFFAVKCLAQRRNMKEPGIEPEPYNLQFRHLAENIKINTSKEEIVI